jgi:hypothetical protein
VGPPEENIKLLRHFSQKILNPPLIIGNDLKIQVSSENNLPKNKIVMDEIPASPSKKSLKPRKIERDDDEIQEAKVCKSSVICDDDENSDEKKKNNLKRKELMKVLNRRGNLLSLVLMLLFLIRVEKFSLRRPQQKVFFLILK